MWINDYWQEQIENKLSSLPLGNENVDVITDEVQLRSKIDAMVNNEEATSRPILFLATNRAAIPGSMAHTIKCVCEKRNLELQVLSDVSLFGAPSEASSCSSHSSKSIRTTRANMASKTTMYSLPSDTAMELSLEKQEVDKPPYARSSEHYYTNPLRVKQTYEYGHGHDLFNCSTMAGYLSK